MPNRFVSIIASPAIVPIARLHGRAWIKTHEAGTSVSVTGFLSRDFFSFLILWKNYFNRKSMTSKENYSTLKKGAEQMKKYPLPNGLIENETICSSDDIRKDPYTPDERSRAAAFKTTSKRKTASITVKLEFLIR